VVEQRLILNIKWMQKNVDVEKQLYPKTMYRTSSYTVFFLQPGTNIDQRIYAIPLEFKSEHGLDVLEIHFAGLHKMRG
jgi:hypothetical protein